MQHESAPEQRRRCPVQAAWSHHEFRISIWAKRPLPRGSLASERFGREGDVQEDERKITTRPEGVEVGIGADQADVSVVAVDGPAERRDCTVAVSACDGACALPRAAGCPERRRGSGSTNRRRCRCPSGALPTTLRSGAILPGTLHASSHPCTSASPTGTNFRVSMS